MKNPIKLFYRLKYIERYESFVKSKPIPLAIILVIVNILGGLVFGYALGTIGGGLSSATTAFFSTASTSNSSSSNSTSIRSASSYDNVNINGFSSFFSSLRTSVVDRFILDAPIVVVDSLYDPSSVAMINSRHSEEEFKLQRPPSQQSTIKPTSWTDQTNHEELLATLFNVKNLMNLAHSSLVNKQQNSWTKFKIRTQSKHLASTLSLFMTYEQNNSSSNGTSSSSSSSDLGTTLLQGLFASSIFIGGLAGCLFSMFTGSLLGRKASMLICCLISMLGSIGASASYSYAALIVFRCFLGAGAGISTVVCSMYVAELLPYPKYLGLVGSMYNLGVALGIALGYAFAAIFVRFADMWRAVHAFHNLWSIPLFFIILFIVPESPQFFKDSKEDSPSAPNTIELEENKQSTNGEVKKENDVNTSEVKKEEEQISAIAAMKRLFCSKVIIPLILGCYGMMALEWTGIQSATSFTPSLMQSAGITDALDQQLASFGISMWQVLTVFPNIFLVDRLGRKTLTLVGMSICFLADIGGGFIFQFSENGTDYKIILAIIFICIFLLGFNLGIGSLCYTLAHEVFHGENEKVILYGTGLSTLTMWVTTIILSLFFIPVVSVTSQAIPWFIFAGVTLIGIIMYIFLLKETSPTILAKKAEQKRLKELKEKAEPEVSLKDTEKEQSVPVVDISEPTSAKMIEAVVSDKIETKETQNPIGTLEENNNQETVETQPQV